MTTTTLLIIGLLIVISGLLLTIGIFYQTMSNMGGLLDGFISDLTDRLGPGVKYKPKKGFPLHILMYVLYACTMVWAFLLAAW